MTEDREIAVRGTKIRYRDSGGTGPAVLLTHGIGLMLEIWEPTVAALAGRYRVISWDLPGFGRSEVREQPYSVPFFGDFTAAFLDALGIGKVHAVGHSMGGAVTLAFARKYPSRLIQSRSTAPPRSAGKRRSSSSCSPCQVSASS